MLEEKEQEEIVIDFSEENECAQVAALMSSSNAVAHIQDKIKKQGYTTCEDCGEDIPFERRKAYPSATRCVECQTLFERLYSS